MRCITAVLVLTLSLAAGAACQRRSTMLPDSGSYPPLANTDSEKRIMAAIRDAVNAGATYANVPAADGRFLRLLTEAVNAKRVVEIGTSTGISGLWLTIALERTGGRLTTFEYDPRRAATARENFKKAGVDGIVTIVEGDAHQTITRLTDPVDVVFIDADKDGYLDYLNKMLPLVRPGGLILAHNVRSAPNYLHAVASNPDLETLFYMEGNELSVTLKKR
ncbi:MAG: O-methyltransferase [Bryobacteraceae bacterium]|nr:O-methyltransferase [Bryobacteraceae bacterium]